MSQQYISILICGNQSTNAGWSDLAMFNSATFTLADGVFNGFDHLDNIYTVRIESSKIKGLNGMVDINQVIYTMVKNKVRSAGASRDGRMKIGFSIPKGYRLPDGVTPMQVMDDIESTFIKNCMTGPDPVTGVCYFNSGTLDTSAIKEIGMKYPLVPAQTPFRQMNPTGEVAFIEAGNADGVNLMLKDVQYPEFQPFKEVIIAESSQGATYRRIDGLKIPRRPSYEVMERTKNGIKYSGFKPTGIKVSDPHEIITISPSVAAPAHHHYDPVIFSLATANDIPEVMIDRANETVEVTFTPIPNTQTYTVVLDANETAREYLKDNGPLRLINRMTGKELQMSADRKQLKLKGDENYCFDNNNIAIELPEKTGFKFLAKSVQCIPDSNIVSCTLNIERNRPVKPVSVNQAAATKPSNVTEIRIHVDRSLMPRKNGMLSVCIETERDDFATYRLSEAMASEITGKGCTWTILAPSAMITGKYARISMKSWEYIHDFQNRRRNEKDLPIDINIEKGLVRKKNAFFRFFSSNFEEILILLLTVAFGILCYLYFMDSPAEKPAVANDKAANTELLPTDSVTKFITELSDLDFKEVTPKADEFLNGKTLMKEDRLSLDAVKALADTLINKGNVTKFINDETSLFKSLPENYQKRLREMDAIIKENPDDITILHGLKNFKELLDFKVNPDEEDKD